MFQVATCYGCGECCETYVAIIFSEIARIMHFRNEDLEDWGNYFTLLIEENGDGNYPYLLEIKKGDEGYCIFFDIKSRACVIHQVRPFSCVRYFCEGIRKEIGIEQFFAKHNLAEEYRSHESRFHKEVAILFNAISLFKQESDTKWVRYYLSTDVIHEFALQLQPIEIEVVISVVTAFAQKMIKCDEKGRSNIDDWEGSNAEKTEIWW